MKRDGTLNLGEEAGSFGKMLRRYFRKTFDSTLEIPENQDIWKDVPSLKMLSLLMPVITGEGEEETFLGMRFVRECGNQAFFGPKPDVVKWDEEERMGEQVFEVGWEWSRW